MEPAPAGRVRARDIVGDALGIYRRRFVTVATIGAALFAPLALLEAAAGVAINNGLDGDGGQRAGAVALWLGVAMLMFGSAMCAGFLDRLVGHEFGHEDMSFRRAVMTLPYRRLIGVDVAQAVIVGACAVVGLVPGVVAYTLLCLAGPLVMLEDVGVRRAISRSSALTSRRFGLTLLVVALPVGVEHQVLHALEVRIGLAVPALWVVHAIAAVVVLVPVVLCEITLTYRLTGRQMTSP